MIFECRPSAINACRHWFASFLLWERCFVYVCVCTLNAIYHFTSSNIISHYQDFAYFRRYWSIHNTQHTTHNVNFIHKFQLAAWLAIWCDAIMCCTHFASHFSMPQHIILSLFVVWCAHSNFWHEICCQFEAHGARNNRTPKKKLEIFLQFAFFNFLKESNEIQSML